VRKLTKGLCAARAPGRGWGPERARTRVHVSNGFCCTSSGESSWHGWCSGALQRRCTDCLVRARVNSFASSSPPDNQHVPRHYLGEFTGRDAILVSEHGDGLVSMFAAAATLGPAARDRCGRRTRHLLPRLPYTGQRSDGQRERLMKTVTRVSQVRLVFLVPGKVLQFFISPAQIFISHPRALLFLFSVILVILMQFMSSISDIVLT